MAWYFALKSPPSCAVAYTDRHSLSELCRELIGIEISKQQQSSDWGAADLTPAQQKYAAGDVLYLHQLRDKLEAMLIRSDRLEMAQACFAFLPPAQIWISPALMP